MSFSERIEKMIEALQTINDSGHPILYPMPEGNIGDDELPCFGIAYQEYEIQPSNVSIFQLPVTVYYFHAPVPDNGRYQLPPELVDKPIEIFRTLAAYTPLTHTNYGVDFPEPAGGIGTAAWYDRAYIGCSITAILKEKDNTVWS